MGKGSETMERLAARVLTQDERRERRALAESGGRVQATAGGRLVKPSPSPTVQPKVTQAPAATWD